MITMGGSLRREIRGGRAELFLLEHGPGWGRKPGGERREGRLAGIGFVGGEAGDRNRGERVDHAGSKRGQGKGEIRGARKTQIGEITEV